MNDMTTAFDQLRMRQKYLILLVALSACDVKGSEELESAVVESTSHSPSRIGYSIGKGEAVVVPAAYSVTLVCSHGRWVEESRQLWETIRLNQRVSVITWDETFLWMQWKEHRVQ